jgi:hypothetical protein
MEWIENIIMYLYRYLKKLLDDYLLRNLYSSKNINPQYFNLYQSTFIKIQ